MKKFLKNFTLAFNFALRDISKSKGVLFLTVVSLGIAYAVVFISGGVLSGFTEALKSGSVDTSGYITIYLEDKKTEEEIKNIESKLNSIDNIKGISVRTYAGLSVFRKGKLRGSAGYAAIGLDPEKEGLATKMPNRIIKGNFLKKDDTNSVVIGITMADSLEGKLYDNKLIDIGEKVVYMGPSGKKKEFTIVGIVDAKYFHPNWSNYFLKDDIEYLDNSRKNGEIVVGIFDPKKIDETKSDILEKIPEALVANWKEREGYVFNLIIAIGYITGNITKLLILTTFILTSVFIFINVFQRRRQIGILKSMGANNGFVVKIYAMETIVFSLFSFGIGIIVFFLVYSFTNINPLPSLVGDVKVSLGYADMFYSFISLVSASIMGSILPIYFAVKVQIADVIRNSA